MTTNHAPATWRMHPVFALTILAAFLGFSLAGCGTATPDLFGNGLQAQQEATTPPAAVTANAARIAIAPIIGAPDQVAKQLQAQLVSAMQKQNIVVADDPAVQYTLRGYVVSAREGAGTKVSYIWDVTDPTGKRVHRISGEELTAAADRDPWAAVTPELMANVSEKTATSLASWLPSGNATAAVAAAGQAAAGAVNQAGQAAAQQAGSAVQQARTAANQATGAARGPTTGSIGGAVAAVVPGVIGAPGDGGVSLTRAIRKELSRSGVSLVNSAGAQSYSIEGRVNLKEAGSGQQEINIDWDVKDPAGKKLGTVSQKNSIPKGSLDGSWGRTADAAAAAAAQGIVKLLPASAAN